MQIDRLWSVVLQTGQSTGMEAYIAHGVVAIFAAVLVLLSLYAWSRRRQVGLLLVSVAFLVFCLKQALWIVSQMYYSYTSSVDLTEVILDLLVLVLFFVAIARRPRKQLE